MVNCKRIQLISYKMSTITFFWKSFYFVIAAWQYKTIRIFLRQKYVTNISWKKFVRIYFNKKYIEGLLASLFLASYLDHYKSICISIAILVADIVVHINNGEQYQILDEKREKTFFFMLSLNLENELRQVSTGKCGSLNCNEKFDFSIVFRFWKWKQHIQIHDEFTNPRLFALTFTVVSYLFKIWVAWVM